MDDLNEFFDRLGVPPEKRPIIIEKLNEKLSYKPKIGFLGKTGAGKSSLCNAIFGQDICEVSDVKSCTRNPQEVFLNMGGKGITLLDLPGLGENPDRDEEYCKLYSSLLPELDLALWVLDATDRAISSDVFYYNTIVKPHIDQDKPFFFALNQVDMIKPYDEWNEAKNCPGVAQFSKIDMIVRNVSQEFKCPESWLIPVSASKKYNLSLLVDMFILALPKEKRFTVGFNIIPENVSERTEKVLDKSLSDVLKEIVSKAVGFAKTIVTVVFEGIKFFRYFRDLFPR